MQNDREVAEMAKKKKMMKKLKGEVEKKKTQIVPSWKNGEGRKEQDDCVLWLHGGRATSMQ